MIMWTATNHSSSTAKARTAATVEQAIEDAKHYVENELLGEGAFIVFGADDRIAADGLLRFTRWTIDRYDQ